MIDAILDFFISTVVDFVFETAWGVFAFFGGKRRGSKDRKDGEKAEEGSHE